MRRLKRQRSKKATIYTDYENDMGVVINWLRLKKVLSGIGEIVKTRNGYSIQVKSKNTKKELNDIVKEKFGAFAKVI